MNEGSVVVGLENMDFPRVASMLSKAYWCLGIGVEEVRQAAANSALVAGVRLSGRQIAYARVISDKTRFAYLCDVIVDEGFRGRGVATAMVEAILAHEELKDVYQWCLVTTDAQPLYAQCGFAPLSRPEKWMEIRRSRPER